jgi:hypothetical protein
MSSRIKVNVKLRQKIKPNIKKRATVPIIQEDSDIFLITEDILPGLIGTYLIYPDNGESYEVQFLGGVFNYKELLNDVGSELVNDLFNNGNAIRARRVNQMVDIDEQFFLDGSDGHCVGRLGIARKLRINALSARPKYARCFLNKANQVEKYFDDNYPDGISIADLRKYCVSENFKIEIQMPLHHKTITMCDPARNPAATFKFINIRKHHVDLCYDMDSEAETLDYESFCLKRSECAKLGALLVDYMKTKEGPVLYKFTYLNNTYVLEGYEEAVDVGKQLGELMLGLSRDFIDSRSPYYNFIRSASRAPCHTFSRRAYVEGSFDIAEYPHDMRRAELRSDLYATDMNKCYRQFRTNKYFIGFPRRPTYMAHNVPVQSAISRAGWWFIKDVTGEIPFYKNIADKVWTTPDLRLFLDNGITFTIPFGCWDHNPDMDFQLPTDKKMYCLFSGLLHREKPYNVTKWIDDSNLLATDIAHGGIKSVRCKRESWRSGCNYSSYIYAYARTRITQYAIDSDAVGISVDAIITESPLYLDEGLSSVLEDGETEYRPIWKAPEQYIPKKYAAPSPDYPSGMRSTRPLNIPQETDSTQFEHIIPDGNILLKGLGGSGKSYAVHKQLGWLAPTYIAPTLALLAEKQAEGWLYYSTPNSFHVDKECKNPHTKSYLRYDRPGIVFIDEVNISAHLDKVLDKCRQYGIRYILAGDEAQITSQWSLSDLWGRLRLETDRTVTFLRDRRSGDSMLMSLKAEVREVVLSDLPIDIRVSKIFYIMSKVKRPTQAQYRTLPLIKLYKHDVESHGELGACQTSTTVDSMQGQTVSTPHICVLNSGTRTDQLPELVYTMVSRFRSISDIYCVITKVRTC